MDSDPKNLNQEKRGWIWIWIGIQDKGVDLDLDWDSRCPDLHITGTVTSSSPKLSDALYCHSQLFKPPGECKMEFHFHLVNPSGDSKLVPHTLLIDKGQTT